MAIEEYAPDLRYVPGETNVVADALSRLPLEAAEWIEPNDEIFDLREGYKFMVHVTFKTIAKEQALDQWVRQIKAQNPGRIGMLFEEIGQKTGFWPRRSGNYPGSTDGKERVIVPQSLRKRLIQWYHTMSMNQHYSWPTMKKDIQGIDKKLWTMPKGQAWIARLWQHSAQGS